LRQHSPRLASRGAKLSCCEKCWTCRVVEHSVLASTIVSLEFLDLSAAGIRFGRFLVCGPRTPFLLDRFLGSPHKSEKSLARTRIPYRNSWLRTFVSGTRGIGGVRIKPFSCARNSCRTLGAAFTRLIVCRLRMSLRVDTTRFSKEERGWSLTNR
jgi:hypothetical protein